MVGRGSRYGLLDADIESIVRSQDLIYEDAATCWQDGHILGNGDMGAVCYAPYWLEWTVNKVDVFDGRVADVSRLTHRQVLEEIRRRNAPNLRFLNELEQPKGKFIQPRSKICGQVKIRLGNYEYTWGSLRPHKVRQRLNLMDAKEYMDLDMHMSHPRIESFVCADRNVLSIHVDQVWGAVWNHRVELCRPYDEEMERAVFGKKENIVWFVQKIPHGAKYAMAMLIQPFGKVLPRDLWNQMLSEKWHVSESKLRAVGCEGDRVWIETAGHYDVFIATATSYETKDPLDKAKKLVREAASAGYKSLEKIHKHWWHDFWRKSFIEFPDDPMVEQLWYLSLYETGSLLRKAPVPGLYGLWYGATDSARQGLEAAWYTTDQNMQMPALSSLMANHVELTVPFMETFLNIMPEMKKHTRELFDMPGICVPVTMTQEGKEITRGAYRYTLNGGPYCGIVFVWAYRYTRNRRLLKEKIYPYLREVVRFFSAFMQKGDDGRYHLQANVGSENVEEIEYDSPAVLTYLKLCFEQVIEASQILKTDEKECKRWQDILSRFPQYTPLIGLYYQTGGYTPLTGLCYGTGGLGLDNELVKSLRQKLKNLGTSWLAISYADFQGWHVWLILGWFFYGITAGWLGLRKVAQKIFDDALRCFLKPNGLFAHNAIVMVNPEISERNLSNIPSGTKIFPDGSAAPRKEFQATAGETTLAPHAKEMACPVSEGNAYFLMATNNMLLQSNNGEIVVFPGVSRKTTARFDRLRIDGALLVSAEMIKGHINFVKVYAEHGGCVRIRNPWRKKNALIIRSNGSQQCVNGKTISLEIRKGELVKVREKDVRLRIWPKVKRQTGPKKRHFQDGSVALLGKG